MLRVSPKCPPDSSTCLLQTHSCFFHAFAANCRQMSVNLHRIMTDKLTNRTQCPRHPWSCSSLHALIWSYWTSTTQVIQFVIMLITCWRDAAMCCCLEKRTNCLNNAVCASTMACRHAGCSAEAIKTLCTYLARAASSKMCVLRLGPLADDGIFLSQQSGSELQSGWEADAFSALQKLVQQLPNLQAVEVWGLHEAQLTQLQSAWPNATRMQCQSDQGGARLALPGR